MPSDDAHEPRVFKHDQRSKVTLLPAPHDQGASRVVKRFVYSPFKQRLTYTLGLHPAQKERRAVRWLHRRGVPVVPILDLRPDHGEVDNHCFEVVVTTAYHGPSLQQALQEGNADTHGRLFAAVTPLVHALLDRRIFFKDLKVSNIVLGPEATETLDPRLIDTGSARPGLSTPQRERMLGMLRQTCQSAGAAPPPSWT